MIIQRVYLPKYSEEDILIEYKDESQKQIQCKESRFGGGYVRLGRFCCYVMLKDEELMYLDVRDDFIEYNVINEVPLRYIWEFKKQITAGNIHEWLLSRLPDDNRHNLLSECARAGIRPIGSDIFRISEGLQLYDDYWFKFVPQDSDTLEQVIAEE